jgi:hypothetical protein
VFYLAIEGGGPSGILLKRYVASVPWDLSAPPERLTNEAKVQPEDATVGPAHGQLAVRVMGYGLPGEIVMAPLDTPAPLRPFISSPADDETPRLSPDGKLLAYASDETGQYEVYVRPVAGPGGRVQISAGGGVEPVWRRDGGAIYYRGQDRMMLATLTTAPTLVVAKRDSLAPDPYVREIKAGQYDVLPNGDLLMLKSDNRTNVRPAVIVNWPELLRRRSK